MPLVFSAILPHSPLLIPNIGKDNLAFFPKTLAGAAELAERFKASAPETVIVISGYGPKRPLGFAMNVAPDFRGDLSAFGDLVTELTYAGDSVLPGRLRESLEGKCSLQLTTNQMLDYGSTLPLYLLRVPSALPILPITPSAGSLKENYDYGQLLQRCLFDCEQRIAIIASADLSHKLSKKSPAGYSLKAKKLDQKIVDILVRHDVREALALSEKALSDALVEDMNTLTLFLGLLDGYELPGQLLAYESPFGIGHALVTYRI